MIALLVWHEEGLSLTDLGTRSGRDLSSLSQAVNRLRKRIEKNPDLARALDRVRQNLAEIHIHKSSLTPSQFETLQRGTKAL
jgi:hypothetical protein